MRHRFISQLAEIAEKEPRIILLTGDLGYSVIETFADRFPDRFINVGVAEQNMVGVACGLAEAGYIPFIYSIATFASLRPYEFIRNCAVFHDFPVRIVGVGGGYEYGANGLTHHALEDIGLMRLQPSMRIVVPADAERAADTLRTTWDAKGPIYYRVGKNEDYRLGGGLPRFQWGRAQTVIEGDDLLFIASGGIVVEAETAVRSLSQQGVRAGLMVVESIAPAPVQDIIRALSTYRIVFTVEAHYETGGLGTMVAELISESNLSCRLKRFAAVWAEDGLCGSQEYLQRKSKLDSQSLEHAARKALFS